MVINPDPHRGRREMLLNMSVRDVRVMGIHLEVRRTIQCTLGEPQLKIFDQVTNRGDAPVPHNYLYHCNFGYPFLDEGAQLVYRGKAEYWQMPDMPAKLPSAAQVKRMKRVPAPLPEHTGMGERGMIVDVKPDRAGNCHVGVVNRKLKLAVEMIYPADAMPRMANWQHFSGNGAYVTALEPFHGSLMGLAKDNHPKAKTTLRPGQTQRYELLIKVHGGAAAAKALEPYDGDVTLR